MAETPIPRGSRPRGTRTDTGRPRNVAAKTPHPPRKRGPKPVHRKTDITVPPAYVGVIDKVSARDRIPKFEWHRLAVHAYAKHLLDPENQFEPRPLACEACGRPFIAPRAQGGKKRLRVTVNFDGDTIVLMDWIADNFYHGVWSQAFENACKFFLGPDAPEPAKDARGMR